MATLGYKVPVPPENKVRMGAPGHMPMKAGNSPTWLLITTIVSAVMGLGSLMFVLFVPMLFDNPRAVHNPATVSLAVSIVSFPIACLFGVVFSWRFFRRDRVRLAVFAALLPLLPLLAGFLSAVALQWFYGGNFGG